MASMSLRTITGLIVWIACFWGISASAASEASDPNSPKLVRVPVFFVTDRNLVTTKAETGPVFGGQRKYTTDCKHDPFMGYGYFVIENKSAKQLTGQLIAQGWSAAAEHEKDGFSKIELIKDADFPTIEKQFCAKVQDSALKSKSNDVVVFAHGYNNPFDAALRTAARFSYEYETPAILYSWPSVGKLRSYSSDETNNEWSQEHYNEFISKLEEVCSANPSMHLRVFAHSMGSRLVIRATPFLREKDTVREVAVICPDIDQGLVNHYCYRYLSAKGTANLRVYMSQDDKALVFSQLVHGGYTRLGECADALSSMATNIFKLQDPTAKPNSEEQKRMDEVKEITKRRLQTIDFTDFDSGLIGHKIPAALMASMSYTNTPGPGLKLVEEASGQRNRGSRVLSRITRHKQNNVISKDHCLRVVKVDAPAGI